MPKDTGSQPTPLRSKLILLKNVNSKMKNVCSENIPPRASNITLDSVPILKLSIKSYNNEF